MAWAAGVALSVALATVPVAAKAEDGAGSGPVMLVMGDSLSAEYGIRRDSGWVALLKERLAQRKLNWRVVNASVSGETTSGGRSRLQALLDKHKPSLVIIELGANDALRGLPLSKMRENLSAMLDMTRQAKARAVIVGMRIPPNFGRQYAEEFHASFGQIAKEASATSVPFLLEGVAQDLNFFQADRIHPNEQAQSKLLDNVWPALEPFVQKR
ncbi:MAG TPA: arylesterase [Burkholderiaceae bacterium]|nr:arylesterase [Burkholderiaceae bacterium]